MSLIRTRSQVRILSGPLQAHGRLTMGLFCWTKVQYRNSSSTITFSAGTHPDNLCMSDDPSQPVDDTHRRALAINLDASSYGVFAEIGAGQEVARWFFRVGGAAGTIAKSISAYDMIISDAIYGTTELYVSRYRLQMMLDYEFKLLQERLAEKRGSTTRF